MPVRRRHIRTLADRLLHAAAIHKPPVPVERIARAQHVKVVAQAYEEDLSGFFYRDRKGAVIGVNSIQPPNRRRFTLAHELGHFLLHDDMFEKVHVDREFQLKLRGSAARRGTDPDEIEANLFAAELLMPARFLERDMEGGDSFDLFDQKYAESLARKYKVSLQALLFRLANLNYIAL